MNRRPRRLFDRGRPGREPGRSTPLKALDPALNPHVRYVDGSRRGCLRRVVNRSAWPTHVRAVETIDVRATPVTTSPSSAVEAGASTIVST